MVFGEALYNRSDRSVLCFSEGKGEAAGKFSEMFIISIYLVGRGGTNRRAVDSLLGLDIKDLFKGKPLARTRGMIGFFG